MANETRDELEGLAAEFVVGTLTEEERTDARFRMRADPDFKKAVEAWDTRLVPFIAGIPPAQPPAGLEQKILQRITDRREAADGVIGLQRQLRRWQRFSWASAAIAAGLVVLLFGLLPREIERPAGPSRYVAALHSEGQMPGFIVTLNLDGGEISVQRVAAPVHEERSYELWAVGGGRDKPESLGVVETVLKIPAAQFKAARASLENTSFAISLEPKGGSPIGQPTGTVLFSGKLVPTP
jgi:anti-sigma-K factor RskA